MYQDSTKSQKWHKKVTSKLGEHKNLTKVKDCIQESQKSYLQLK